jgi:hypothetical protein
MHASVPVEKGIVRSTMAAVVKINFRRIIQIIVFYSFCTLALQSFVGDNMRASQLPEDIKLQELKIKMPDKNITLEQAFQLIELQTNFKFFYVKEDVPLDQKVKIIHEEESLYQILQVFAKEFDLAFIRINYQIVVKKSDGIHSKTWRITGAVRDGSTHEPLVFASVIVKGTLYGAATDAKGNFLLDLPQGNDTLRCSYVGYKSVDIPVSVDNDIQLSITLYATDMFLQDVTIYAYQGDEKDLANESVLSLQSEKIKTSTSIFPDVLRSVQMLPGVSTNNEFNAKFNVHGGNPDENLVLVNGTQVYEPYHLKEIPNYGIGILNTELINKMDLMTGGFPARYGDKMSSVLNIDYREGDRGRFQGTASLSFTDVDLLAEGPLSENGSFIVGARKTYLEYIMKLVSPKETVFPSFYDIQGVVDYSLTPSHKLLFKFIHAGDDAATGLVTNSYGPYEYYSTRDNFTHRENSNDTSDTQMQYSSTLFALQSINVISSSTILKTELSLYDQRENEQARHDYQYQTHIDGQGYFFFYNSTTLQRYNNTLLVRTMEINSTLDQQLSAEYWMKTGVSYQHITYEEDQIFLRILEKTANWDYSNNNFGNYPDTNTVHQIDNPINALNNQMNTVSFKIGGYVENIIQVSNQLLLNIGGRLDYFDLNKNLTWSPRVSLACQITGGLTVRGAWGYYYQSPNYRQVAYPAASDTNTQAQKAIHYVLGIDYTLYLDSKERSFLKVKAECFYKKYDDLMSATQTSYGYVYYSKKNDATGSSKGIDAYFMFSLPEFYGWISYSYLEAMQDIRNDTYGVFPRNADQRHTLAVVGDLDLGSQWNIAMRYTYGSGYPYTPQFARQNTATHQWDWSSGAPNSERLPSYKCMDIRMTKSFVLFGLSTSVFLDVSNVLMANNIITYQYYIDNNQPVKNEVNLPPLIPSIGISVRF